MIRLAAELFAGQWHLGRRIEDALGAQSGRFDGMATFSPTGTGLHYVEQGTLTLDAGGRFAAERAYLWRFAAGRVEVAFDDGRPFHSFGVDGAGTDHPCGADHYRVRYDFGGWPLWRARWTVSGPKKSYVSDTTYSPRPLRTGAERA